MLTAYNVFRTEQGDLVILATAEDPTDPQVLVVAAADVEQFYSKVSGAIAAEVRRDIRPIPPPEQNR